MTTVVLLHDQSFNFVATGSVDQTASEVLAGALRGLVPKELADQIELLDWDGLVAFLQTKGVGAMTVHSDVVGAIAALTRDTDEGQAE